MMIIFLDCGDNGYVGDQGNERQERKMTTEKRGWKDRVFYFVVSQPR